MRKLFIVAVLANLCFNVLYANDYENAWTAINRKDIRSAKEYLSKAKNNPSTALDAYLTELFLQTYSGKEQSIPGLTDKIIQHSDKNAYLYSLWFNGAVLGQYGKKKEYQLNFLNKIINDESFNGSIRSAAHYVKALHYVYANEYAKAKNEWAAMKAVEDWQLTGPFENLSGSGFNNNYGVLTGVDAAARFKGMNNIEVAWFTPSRTNREGCLRIIICQKVRLLFMHKLS
jgi:hypothetical protein